MALVGALFAVPVGAVLARRRKSATQNLTVDEPFPSAGSTSPRALAHNYWRDQGHPPFMKPSHAEPDQHMFDPERLP